jgi:hypothetical protein
MGGGGGSRDMVVFTLNLCITWIQVASLMLQVIYPQRKIPRYQLNRRLDCPENRYGHFGVEVNVFPLPRCEPRTTQPLH